MRYRELSAPISIQFEITGACNNNCVHCYNHWRIDNNQARHKSSLEKLLLIKNV